MKNKAKLISMLKERLKQALREQEEGNLEQILQEKADLETMCSALESECDRLRKRLSFNLERNRSMRRSLSPTEGRDPSVGISVRKEKEEEKEALLDMMDAMDNTDGEGNASRGGGENHEEQETGSSEVSKPIRPFSAVIRNPDTREKGGKGRERPQSAYLDRHALLIVRTGIRIRIWRDPNGLSREE